MNISKVLMMQEKKLISLYQEMQRLKFLVEINYIGTDVIIIISTLFQNHKYDGDMMVVH